MSIEVLAAKIEQLPGGKLLEAKGNNEVYVFVCKSSKTYVQVPFPEDKPEDARVIVMENEECLLRLPAQESDIPAIVALVANRAAHRRK